jgi:hypothetical protein
MPHLTLEPDQNSIASCLLWRRMIHIWGYHYDNGHITLYCCQEVTEMLFFRLLFVAAGAAALLAASPAFSDALPARLRGTITAIDVDGITLNERDGRSFRLATGSGTTYANVVPSSLKEIKVGDYVGSAVKGPRDHLIAVEIVVVPTEMQAGRIGYYAWDPLPDTSGIEASGITGTNMTNGVVSNVSPATPAMTETTMTNGTVVASNDGAAGRTLTVNLVGDKPANILVSSAAPIVRFVPSKRSTISVGSAVVVWTKPGNRARLIAVGKGVTPPM